MRKHAIIIVVFANLIVSVSCWAQGGSLTPHGPPGPTMLSLDEMEPRTPLVDGAPGVSMDTNGTTTVSQSGSYYLTGNLTVANFDGIVVNASGVTLDLRGFTIRTTFPRGASGTGIAINSNHVSVFNGHIVSSITYDSQAVGDQYRGPGFNHGIKADPGGHVRIRDVSVSGINLYGIYCEDVVSSVVESCTVETVGSIGIQAGSVRNCTAATCGGTAILGLVVDTCYATSTGAEGIFANTINNCYARTESTDPESEGIRSQTVVQNSYGLSSGGDGIRSMGCVANCYGYTVSSSIDADGIQAGISVQNSYGLSYNGDGIRADIVSFSVGYGGGAAASADGIEAFLAVGCHGPGGENVSYKYLMP